MPIFYINDVQKKTEYLKHKRFLLAWLPLEVLFFELYIKVKSYKNIQNFEAK